MWLKDLCGLSWESSLTLMTPEALTGYRRAKTMEFLSHLEWEHPDLVASARIAVIYREGARDFRGALGLNWRECQMLSMVGEMKVVTLSQLEKEVFEQVTVLWSLFSLADLEKIQLEQGMPEDDPEAAWDSHRLA